MGANRGNNKPYISRVVGRGGATPIPPFALSDGGGSTPKYFFSNFKSIEIWQEKADQEKAAPINGIWQK